MQNKTAQIPEGSSDRIATTAPTWKKGVLASAAALALFGVSLQAQALALGAVTVRSSLGEPLRAEIEVPQISSAEAASFQAKVASPQAFRAAGVEYSPALAGARVTLHRRANGQAYLRVAGDRPINEPFLGVVIEADWKDGRVVRDYTMLVDPPGRAAPPPVTVTQSQTAPLAPPPVMAPPPPVVSAPPVAVQTTPPAEASAPTRAAPRAQPARPAARREPAPEVAPAAAASAGGGEQVTVKRGDTANAIAAAHRPEGVSLDQMLVAMLRANPRAFIGGNVNRMRSGAVLNMPTAEQAAATPQRAARRAVVAQTRDFNNFRRGVASAARSTPVASAGRSTSGGVQAQVQESRPAAPAQDRLTVSKGAQPSGTETKLAQSRQAQEQAERVAELNKNIGDLAKLQGASGAAAAASPAPSTPSVSVPVGAPPAAPAAPVASAAATPPVTAPAAAAASAAVAAASSAATAAAATAADAAASAAQAAASAAAPVASAAADGASSAASAVESAASAADAAASAAAAATVASAPAPVVRPAPAPAPVEEPSLVDSLMENPLLPIAGAGLLALLAGYGVYRSRQRKKEAAPLDSSFIESRLQPDSFFGASGGQRVNTKDGGGTVGSSSMAYSPSQLDAAGDVDPVAEADVYLAYGRDMQAEEILKEALRTQPNRASIHRKLAEIYAKRRDARALEAIATEAYGVTGGDGPDWLAITSLGSELEPDNQLYQPGGAPAVRTAQMPVRQTFGADTEPQTAQMLEKAARNSGNAPLDLNLDLDDAPVRAAPSQPASLAPAAAAGVAAAAAGAALAATRAPSPAPAPVVTPASTVVTPPPAADAPLDFDLDLDFSPPSQLGAPTRPPVQTVTTAPATLAPAPAGNNTGMIDFDMDALSVNPDSRSGGELRTEQPDDVDEDPLGTKLALAQEFHAIGDTEGARTLVKEVIAESSGALRVRAERFLAELT